MASWTESEDRKTYVFTLRDGLKWHDGAPVTSEDCIASIKRWADADATGQVLMTLIDRIEAVDAKQFRVVLKQPTSLLLEGLAKLSSRPLFMMPKRIADTPSAQPITEFIGSGPFKFVASEFKPGLKVVYEKNKDYVPRRAAQLDGGRQGGQGGAGRMGGHARPDDGGQRAAERRGRFHAAGAVRPAAHGRGPGQPAGPRAGQAGAWTYFRMNHLYPPFDNKLLRQAAIAAVSRGRAQGAGGQPKYYRTCAAVMGCGNPMGDNYGEDWVVPARIDRAQALLKEAGYDGTPVVILQPSDIAMVSPQPVVVGAALRKAGFKVVMKAMDWQSVVSQQGNQKSPADGGWNIFSTYSILATSGDPFGNTTLAANGRKAWAGWPDVPRSRPCA